MSEVDRVSLGLQRGRTSVHHQGCALTEGRATHSPHSSVIPAVMACLAPGACPVGWAQPAESCGDKRPSARSLPAWSWGVWG